MASTVIIMAHILVLFVSNRSTSDCEEEASGLVDDMSTTHRIGKSKSKLLLLRMDF